MEANEIRLENYFKHNSEWCYRGDDVSIFQWDEADWYALGECTLSLDNIEPIPLTEDWLLSFGFKWEILYQGFHNGKFKISERYNGGYSFHLGNDIFLIEHVHQLQNLYFALTGKELKRVEKEQPKTLTIRNAIKAEEALVELQNRLKKEDVNNCNHPRNQRTFIGQNLLRCELCGEEFS